MATTTYRQHPPIYYTIRTCVRWLFWTTVATAILSGVMVTLDYFQYRNADPVCDVTVNRDFTWKWNGTPVALSECRAPSDIVLNDDGRWDWFDPYIHG